jgi:hypothetical protein
MGRSSGWRPGAGIRSNDRRRPGSNWTNGRPPWFVLPPQSLHSSCHGVSPRPRGDKPVFPKKKRGKGAKNSTPTPEPGTPGTFPWQRLVFTSPKTRTTRSRSPSAQLHQASSPSPRPARPARRGRSPSSPRLQHARFLFRTIMAVARCLCALLALAVAPAPATAQMTVDLTSRGEFPVHCRRSQRRARGIDSKAPQSSRDQLTNTKTPPRIHQSRRQAHRRQPLYILPRRRARTDTRHPPRATAGRPVLLVVGRGHVGDHGRLLALHGRHDVQ